MRADVTNPDESEFPGTTGDQPLRLRRGDSANLHVAGFRTGDGTPAVWATGDVLTFTLRDGLDSPKADRSRQLIQHVGTYTVGQATATVAIMPADWLPATEGISASFDDRPRVGREAVADLQLTRADGSVWTLWQSAVIVEPDVT